MDAIAHRLDVLDVDTVDLGDLGHQQIDQPAVGEFDDQVVDRSSAPALEDLDPDDLTANCADPAGDGAQRARTVGQPYAHHVRLHERHRTVVP